MTTPIYNPNTPTPRLPYADWQVQFLQNFQKLATSFSQNHVALDDATMANRGNHTYVQFPEQSNDPQSSSQEYTIFSKDLPGQTDQLYITYPGNTPVVQFTNYQIYTVPSNIQNGVPIQTFFFTFLPGGILAYFGTFLMLGSSASDVQLFLKPPIAKNIISAQFTLSATTPDYTPGIFLIPPEIQPPDNNGIITSVLVNVSTLTPFPKAIFYLILANI